MAEGDDLASRVVNLASNAAFGRPLITNVHRGLLAEAIVSSILPSSWNWCSVDYASWDFEHQDRTRLEVKQSAVRQSSATVESAPSRCSFDIAPRTGFHDGANWIDTAGRPADIYLFAHHAVADNTADHRVPQQWAFYPVKTRDLPHTLRISIKSLQRLMSPIPYDALGIAVETVRSSLLEETH